MAKLCRFLAVVAILAVVASRGGECRSKAELPDEVFASKLNEGADYSSLDGSQDLGRGPAEHFSTGSRFEPLLAKHKDGLWLRKIGFPSQAILSKAALGRLDASRPRLPDLLVQSVYAAQKNGSILPKLQGVTAILNATELSEIIQQPTNGTSTSGGAASSGPDVQKSDLAIQVQALYDAENANLTALAETLRVPHGFELAPSANRSNDLDVIVIKKFAEAALADTEEEHIDDLAESILLSIYATDDKDGWEVDEEDKQNLKKLLADREYMLNILYSDPNEEYDILDDKEPCVDCLENRSFVCSLCWPSDFCLSVTSGLESNCASR